MVTISSDILHAWISGLLWPLTRILGMIAITPLFNHRSMPTRYKVGMAVFITLAVMPSLPPMPQVDMLSFHGAGILVQQLLIGITIGFVIRIVFASVDLAGQLSAMSMGLGFATFYDPQSQGQSTSVSQLFTIIAMLFFLSINGHLIMIMSVTESFITMPIQAELSNSINFQQILHFGGNIFSTGLHIALPVIAALLITNLALGILSRTAPQLNLFGIGFPITISIGLIIIALSFPRLAVPLERLMSEGFSNITLLMTTGNSR